MAKTSETALVIVDVQPMFIPKLRGQTHPSLKNIIKLYKSAKRRGIPVIVLEYTCCGKSIPEIQDEISSHYTVKRKGKDDGSAQVVSACKELGIKPKRLVFCGYNHAACVFETVNSLRVKPDGEIIIVKDATNYCRTIQPLYNRMYNVKHHEMYPGLTEKWEQLEE